MIPKLGDLTVLDYTDAVSADYGIEPVCDDQQRFALAKLGYDKTTRVQHIGRKSFKCRVIYSSMSSWLKAIAMNQPIGSKENHLSGVCMLK